MAIKIILYLISYWLFDIINKLEIETVLIIDHICYEIITRSLL